MVDITLSQVADTLHTSATELPSGASTDIDAAETIVGDQVEPYTTASGSVEQTAIYVACAFITTTEGDYPVSDLDRETSTISFDTDVGAASDFWSRAKATDPTGRLGNGTIGFEAY